MKRLFTAVGLPDQIREVIAIPQGTGLKEVSRENLHITLRYLGEVKHESVDEIREALGVVKFTPFEVEAAGAGCFPNRRNPSVLWMGVEPTGPLEALFFRVEEALKPLAFGPEARRYHPHITVARVQPFARKAALEYLEQHEADVAGRFVVGDFRLYESILHRSGPEYRVIETYGAI
jgi:RNA 2',3'-cyclic 3'-phosphodiesterase